MRKISRIVQLLLAVLAASCGEHRRDLLPTSPTVAAPTVVAPPTSVAPATTIRGFVLDTAYRALPGARVEVVSGDSTGIIAFADADGIVMLNGRFTKETLFRATAEDHDARAQSWNCSVAVCGGGGANPWLGFYLNPLVPPVDISGAYTLTIVADPKCVDIPEELRERRYGASVSAQPVNGRPATPGFDLTVTDDSMIGRYRGFAIGVAGTRLGFDLHGGHDPVIVERLTGNQSISVSGWAATTVAGSQPSVITAALDGWIEYAPPRGTTINCPSTAHQIILRRSS